MLALLCCMQQIKSSSAVVIGSWGAKCACTRVQDAASAHLGVTDCHSGFGQYWEHHVMDQSHGQACTADAGATGVQVVVRPGKGVQYSRNMAVS